MGNEAHHTIDGGDHPATRQGRRRADVRGRRRRFARNWLAAGSAALIAATSLAACGGSSSSTTYWRAHFTDGQSLYLSLVNMNGQISGWAKYTDGTFQAFTGTADSDGTLDVTAYDGETLSINGDSMTATSQDGEGNMYFAQVSQSAYQSAGGPTA